MARAWSSFRVIGKARIYIMSIFIIIPSFSDDYLSIFEIYPQSETPMLVQIADLEWLSSEESPYHFLPDTLIYRTFHEDRIVFRVLNYRTNHSARFSADVDVKKRFGTKPDVEVFSFFPRR